MHNLTSLVLGGGRGTRLYPLTKYRSKPAVPLAGKYRLIDIPLSNCINSGLNRIYVLTQFNSVSLHRHIRRSYNFDAFNGGFVEILAAQQTMDQSDWYQGTADAVRQHLRILKQPGLEYVLILSGDQLYRMDFRRMLATHRDYRADVTIATMPVHQRDASALGIMRVGDDGLIKGFLEKPKKPEELQGFLTDPKWIDKQGIPAQGRECLASMGIYLFNRDVLVEALEKTTYHDFGREIFPATIRAKRVAAHLFDGYWEDIGTIRSFYEANRQLAAADPPFSMFSQEMPIYSRARFLPPSRIAGATIRNSLIADGCTIGDGTTIEGSVIGSRCQIGPGVTIRDAVIMGADEFQSPAEIEADRRAGRPSVGIGRGTVIAGAIIDKNCRIGAGVRIANDQGLETGGAEGAIICDGIVVVERDAALADGWALEPQ